MYIKYFDMSSNDMSSMYSKIVKELIHYSVIIMTISITLIILLAATIIFQYFSKRIPQKWFIFIIGIEIIILIIPLAFWLIVISEMNNNYEPLDESMKKVTYELKGNVSNIEDKKSDNPHIKINKIEQTSVLKKPKGDFIVVLDKQTTANSGDKIKVTTEKPIYIENKHIYRNLSYTPYNKDAKIKAEIKENGKWKTYPVKTSMHYNRVK
ncbi:hypothetical protein [Staphylococcus hominis]|uniref:hypothetical protein n=1 Tax=Staphylococcus hominis TaxID=1290 RepID=UPI003DA09B96